jgi:hypothetical protein
VTTRPEDLAELVRGFVAFESAALSRVAPEQQAVAREHILGLAAAIARSLGSTIFDALPLPSVGPELAATYRDIARVLARKIAEGQIPDDDEEDDSRAPGATIH